jgi:hypothetical protein
MQRSQSMATLNRSESAGSRSFTDTSVRPTRTTRHRPLAPKSRRTR